jgi:hypothetical protein
VVAQLLNRANHRCVLVARGGSHRWFGCSLSYLSTSSTGLCYTISVIAAWLVVCPVKALLFLFLGVVSMQRCYQLVLDPR